MCNNIVGDEKIHKTLVTVPVAQTKNDIEPRALNTGHKNKLVKAPLKHEQLTSLNSTIKSYDTIASQTR